jgi:hypothetical protein
VSLRSSSFRVVAQSRVVTNQQHISRKTIQTNATVSALHNITAVFAISYSENEKLQHLYTSWYLNEEACSTYGKDRK